MAARPPSTDEGVLRRWLLPAALAALVIGVLDALWISFVAGPLYAAELGDRLADPVVGWAAAVFYVVHVVSVTVLAIRPALDVDSLRVAAVHGLVLGVGAYATFGFTNLAVLADWTLLLAVTDTLWGGFLTATAAVIPVFVLRRTQHRD